MGIRSFLALELPDPVKQILLRLHNEIKGSPLDVRWVRPEGIHLTLVFLGDIREADLSPIIDAVGKGCSSHEPFPISLQGMGCFPNSRSPRVLWVGVESDLERMARFRDDLQDKLIPFGIRPEKKDFRPHLTLGRFRKPGKKAAGLEEVLSEHRGLTSPLCSLNELVLFKSELKPGGAVYTKMKSWRLTGEQ